MTSDDHAALVALGRRMAATNGYTPMQSSSLYVTDGDEIDWAYGHEGIFMYTFEMYPSHTVVSSTARFYPADELIAPQTDRNKEAILTLIEAAGCPVLRHRQVRHELRPAVRHVRDHRWLDDQPAGHGHRHERPLGRADPQATNRQAGTVTSGSRALVTGHLAGATPTATTSTAGSTTVRSPASPCRRRPGR